MRKFYFAVALPWLLAAGLYGQQVSPDSLDTRLKTLEKSLAPFKNLKISGYLQGEWQLASASGIHSYAGGDFPTDANNRFMVRRGRLKFTFSNPHFHLVYQPEITEKGIALKDAYGMFTEPWLGQFSLTAGVFNRPFSYENIYSSGSRESPERARFSQILLPNERETGVMLCWKWNDLKVEGGLFNGNAIAPDNDGRKDFIGRISYSKTVKNRQFGAGVSYYDGSVRQSTNHVFEFAPRNNEHLSGMFLKDTASSPQVGHYAHRQYWGFDAQYSVTSVIGKTTLRAETAFGTQPGLQKSNESARTKDGLVGDLYIRKVAGGTFYLVQMLGKAPFQAVLKYDWFDPNTHVSGAEIGQNNANLGAADVRYTTWGFGLSYLWQNLTLTGYYDLVRNEKAPNLPGFEGDLSDNVFTLRMQVKF